MEIITNEKINFNSLEEKNNTWFLDNVLLMKNHYIGIFFQQLIGFLYSKSCKQKVNYIRKVFKA